MKNFIKFFLVTVFALSFLTVNAESLATPVTSGDVDPEGEIACFDLTMNLRYKDTDAKTNGQVSQLQDFLVSQGYINGNPTGYFGLGTFGAVKKFQARSGLSPTGFVGGLTRGKIKDATCNGDGGTISNIPTLRPIPDYTNPNNPEVRPVGSFTITPNVVSKTIKLGEKFEQTFSVQAGYEEQKDGRYFTWNLGKGSMPDGISLSNIEGWKTTVLGTPKTEGLYSFTVEAYSIQNKAKVASSVVYLNVMSSTSSNQPYITMVSGKGAGNFEIDAGSPSYISGSNLSNVSVSVGGKLATVTQTGDSFIYATMPSDLVPGQTYDLYVFNEKGAVSRPVSNVVKVKVLSKMTSDSTTSTKPSIKILSPNGAETWTFGQLQTVRWDYTSLSGNVTAYLISQDADTGAAVCKIAISPVNQKSFTFVPTLNMPCVTSSSQLVAGRYVVPGRYKIRIIAEGQSSTSDLGIYDESDSYFTIVPSTSSTSNQPSVTLYGPGRNDFLRTGGSAMIRWGTTAYDKDAKISIGLYDVRYSTEGGRYPERVLASGIPNTGTYIWNIPQDDYYVDYDTTVPNHKIKIYVNQGGVAGVNFAESNYPFILARATSTDTIPTTTVYPTKIALISPSHAKVGDTVTLYGMDFNKTALNTIKLRNVSSGQVTNLSFNTYSEVNLSFIVPAGLSVGEYALSVNNNKNTVDSNSVAFWIDPTPTTSTNTRPVISSINPSSALAGAPVAISGSGFNTVKSNIILFKNPGTGEQSAVNYVAESDGSLKLFVPPIAPGTYEITIMNQIVDAFSGAYRFTINAPVAPASSGSSVSLSASLLSSTDDRAGAWGNFGPGHGNSNQSSADWNWSANLNLPSSMTISAIRMDRDSFGEHWSTDRSSDYPLVIVENGSQLNTALGQTISLSAGNHNLKIYGQKEDQNFQGSVLTVLFSDGTSVKTTISPIVSFMQTGDSMMTASMFDALRSVNPSLYR